MTRSREIITGLIAAIATLVAIRRERYPRERAHRDDRIIHKLFMPIIECKTLQWPGAGRRICEVATADPGACSTFLGTRQTWAGEGPGPPT